MERPGLFSLAFTLFVLLVCSIEAPAQEASPPQPHIAVLNFEGRGIPDEEAATLTDRWRSLLVNTGAFVVVDRDNMEEILREFGIQQSGCTTTECAAEAGKMLNVQKMVTGSIGRIGKTYTIDVSVIDVETSRIERSLNEDYRGEIDGLLGVLWIIARSLGGVSGRAKPVAVEFAGEKTSPPAAGRIRLVKLSINSYPQGADVIVNKRTIGKTPLMRSAAHGSRFSIQLQHAGYRDWEEALTMSGDEELTAKLVRLPGAMARSSPRKWIWIAGGAAAVGTAAVILLSPHDGKPSSESLPEFTWPPR